MPGKRMRASGILRAIKNPPERVWYSESRLICRPMQSLRNIAGNKVRLIHNRRIVNHFKAANVKPSAICKLAIFACFRGDHGLNTSVKVKAHACNHARKPGYAVCSLFAKHA
jgi:hypothetical protein